MGIAANERYRRSLTRDSLPTMERTGPIDPALAPADTPLGAAIRSEADRLPAIVRTPEPIRSAKRAEVVIAADAMASAQGMDSADPSPAQMVVDQAAMCVDLQRDRSAPADLSAPVLPRHVGLSARLSDHPGIVRSGLADPSVLARVERAASLAVACRPGASDGNDVVGRIVQRMVFECARRRSSVADMDDESLMSFVEDARDSL